MLHLGHKISDGTFILGFYPHHRVSKKNQLHSTTLRLYYVGKGLKGQKCQERYQRSLSLAAPTSIWH
jgi:hypothetical protein